MGFSSLADKSRRIPDVGRSSPRQAKITGFGLHHNAGVDAYGQATAAGREVSANYWIANDGTLIPNIDEGRRAFTSGAAGYPAGAEADHRNITVEISNSPEGVKAGTWAISAAAEATLTALIADVYRRYDLGPVRRSATNGVGVHRDWVPTACPGDYVMARLPEIIRAAEAARTGTSTTTRKRKKMASLYYTTKNDKRAGQGGTGLTWILAGDSPGTPANWLPIKDQKLANELAAQVGNAAWLTQATAEDWKKQYLSPVRTQG